MEEKTDLLASAREKIETMLEHLEDDQKLTEQECNSVIRDLELLELPQKEEKKGEVQMDTDLETLVRAFSDQADDSRDLLQRMLDVIAQGRVPGENTVEALDSSIALLRRQYASVYQLVREQLPDEEMPSEDSPVTAYSEALANSRSLKYQKLLNQIHRTLENFVAVRSLAEAYTEALQPYQQKAEKLIQELKGPEQLETAQEEVKGPELFLKVLAMEKNPDVDVDNLEELEDQLEDYYSKRVRRGVVKQEYFIDENLLSTESVPESEEAEPEVLKFPCVDEEEIAVEPETLTENPTEALPDEESAQEEPVDDTPADGKSEKDGFLCHVKDAGLIITDTDSVGSLQVEHSEAEIRKVSATIFINEMRKGNRKSKAEAEAITVKMLQQNGQISKTFLTKIILMPENVAEAALDYLFRKGYLVRYSLPSWEEFYVASPRLLKAMAQKESSKFVGIHQNSLDDRCGTIGERPTGAAASACYLKLDVDSCTHLRQPGSVHVDGISMFAGESFVLYNYVKDKPEHADLVYGIFWSDLDECAEFLDTVKKFMPKSKRVENVIFAGLDTEKAEATARLILEYCSCPEGHHCLYSLKEDAFYDYPSLKRIHLFVPENKKQDERDNRQPEPEVNKEPADQNEQKTEAANSVALAKSVDPAKPVESIKEEAMKMPQPAVEQTIHPAMPRRKAEKLMGPDPVTRQESILRFLAENRFYAATAYAKAASLADPAFEKFHKQLAYAVNDPMGHCVYSSDNAFNLFAEDTPLGNTMNVATAIRTFFSNRVRYDYNIKSLYDNVKNSPVLELHPELSKIVYTLMEFKDSYQKGIAAYTGHSRTQEAMERELRRLRHEASDFYDNFVTGRKREKASQKRFIQTKQLIFSPNSEMGEFIKYVADGDMEIVPLLGEFLEKNFFQEDSLISEESIDMDMLWNYIVEFWEKAGDMMMYRRNMNLISSLRTNITNITTKAVQLLARWYVLGDQKISRTEDEGATAYKKVSVQLLENIDVAKRELENAHETVEQAAGTNILLNVLEFVRSSIDGTLDENKQKFYYAPFLLTDDVMLDENCMPEFDTFGSDVAALSPCTRIVAHADKCMEQDYETRLEEMLESQAGDNCGMAVTLLEYLHSMDPEWDFRESLEKINDNEQYAKRRADLDKDDFIGEMELAQSYGQIDNSEENIKEKILQIVDNWYEWAETSTNYGFFRKVLNAYLSEIRENAKAREVGLLEQLKNFRIASVPGLSIETKNKRIERIETVIKSQNYTVAEDLLARAASVDDEAEDIIDEDFLQDFLDNYDDYYHPVASNRTTLASLVNTRIRNKQGRGAQKLVDNWLPGGGLLGPERLRNLLICMGFRIARIDPQNAIGKFENFVVHTANATAGMRNNYTHPIAALGSDAMQNGFRVVCLNGVYEADSLVDVMKQIGNAKHTIILLDCAMTLGERRRLARKTKSDLGDKLFAVIDRTVMMFLIRNYDETRINRMLVALVTPFGCYQPYVWESSNVMPPEIFIGRKHELERIKAPKGTNIVYGGRQLGKSALLKKAREDIDRNENNDRAVYLEIKGLDYQRAAQKIAHELYDQGVLEEDLDTSDWDVLARAIKRRLQKQEKRINYLLLLLDEADAFIESSGTVNYQPFDALKEIQSVGRDRFKFVVAGLRNIVRFKREAALSNNSVLTHLEAMTVKPFSPSEARELMELPLHYLGLRFPKEKDSLVTLILATTNYFPGLIQMYCAKLLEAMRNKNYAGYSEANTPVYEVSEDHIKKVLSDPEFTQQIREKFVITLKLDEDNYYYLIALIMAYLYHTNGYNEGYTAEAIHQAGSELAIGKISRLEMPKLSAFMEELRELNVLRSTDESHYLFTRFTFFQMMGTSAEVEDHLMEYMEA